MSNDRRENRTGSGRRVPAGCRSGQALAEFALVLPLLLLLVLGVFEFGRAWQTYQVITDATREGARVAVVATTPPADSVGVITVVQQALQRANLPSANATITLSVSPGPWPGNRGDPATVSIQYQFQFLVIGRLLGWATGQENITFSTSTVMRKEW